MKPQILVADDDAASLMITTKALTGAGYLVHAAKDGTEALEQAVKVQPDLVILDVMMPGVDGYEVCRHLRRKPKTARLPVIMLTAQDSLDEKVKGLEAGADDYITKPFQQVELLARVHAWLQRAALRHPEAGAEPTAGKIIAVFSLRGGAGVSGLAANLATALAQLWNQPAVLVDLVPAGGLATLLLNLSPRNTWAHLANIPAEEIDDELLDSLLLPHASGASVLAGPPRAKTSELLTAPKISRVLKLLAARHPYVVLDLPHDLLDAAVAGLDGAHQILAMMTPELGALAGMKTMMQAFEALDYPRDRVRLVLNQVFERNGLNQKEIEEVIKRPFDLVIPFTPDAVAAINLGRPLVLSAPDSPVGALLEDFAFQISKDEHRSQQPAEPTKAFQRATRRLGQQQKGLRRFFG